MTNDQKLIRQILKLNIDGWKPRRIPMSAAISWENENFDSTIYATPGWEDEGMTPFELFDNDECLAEDLIQISTREQFIHAFKKFIIKSNAS